MIFLVLAVGLAAQPAPPFTLLAKGQMSGIDDAREIVVSSQQEWEALWKAHAGTAKRPQVDFSKTIVVGVFLGSRPTSGFDVRIDRVVVEDGAWVVEYGEHRPGRDQVVAQVLTSPYQLVALARHDGPVQFRRLAER
jgi:hypothetical protein